MNLSNYYYYFKSVIPPKICDDIIKYGLSHEEDLAITGGQGQKRNLKEQPLKEEEIIDLKKKRNSNIVWLNDKWIYKEIHPYLHEANKLAGWNFEWSFSESCQFTKYKLSQHYGWHMDSFDKPYDNPNDPNTHGKIRKLSMTCQLTDGSEYSGGELQFDTRNYDPHMRDEDRHVITVKEILPKGSIVVFPSFVWHRVMPVTRGTRYSLVVWNLGYPFK
jgi:PKHD-type hydroxylase